MKQYIHHPDRDEVLEFEVPEGAVYFAVGATCPDCTGDCRRIVAIDHVNPSYRCVGPGYSVRDVPVTQHDGVPPVQWSATIPSDGPAHGCVVDVGTNCAHAIVPRVISGEEYARTRYA